VSEHYCQNIGCNRPATEKPYRMKNGRLQWRCEHCVARKSGSAIASVKKVVRNERICACVFNCAGVLRDGYRDVYWST
jgi:hypothetical protein